MVQTSTGRQIPHGTAIELVNLYRISLGEHVAGRLWNEIFTDQERTNLGGDFRTAYLATEHRGVGMYQAAHAGMTLERALLDAMRSVGWLAQPKYERLIQDVGESIERPTSSYSRPRWMMTHGELSWHDRVVRRIRQPGRARNIVAVLNAFERHGWPAHLSLGEFGNFTTFQMRQTLYDLNDGLEQIKFRMDGSGKAVIWQIAPASPQRGPVSPRNTSTDLTQVSLGAT